MLGDNPQKTHHKKIQKAQDPYIPYDKLKKSLDNLTTLLNDNNVVEVKNTLEKLIPSYKSNSKIVDHVYHEQSKLKNDNQIQYLVKNQKNKVIKIKKLI